MKRVKIMLACVNMLLPLFGLLIVAVFLISLGSAKDTTAQFETGKGLSAETQSYASIIYEKSEEYGIREYARYLLAIMQVESGGRGTDVMQSLGNSGLPEHMKTAELSIETACAYFAALLEQAGAAGVDMETVIQAYNYGGGYINYIAEHGGEHSYSWARDFAAKKSGGVKVAYNNEIAVKTNGGWRYAYGNMFYVYLVKQYLAVDPLPVDVSNAIINEALQYKGYRYVWGGCKSGNVFRLFRTYAMVLRNGRDQSSA